MLNNKQKNIKKLILETDMPGIDVIAHFDEIFLKGKNQPIFIRRLANNLHELFPKTAVQRTEGGFIISNFKKEELGRLAKVPGIAKFAVCKVINNSMEDLKKAVETMKVEKAVKKFRVTASRAYKQYPLTSAEINRELGSLLVEKHGWKVDLKNPDFNLYVDIGKNKAVIYSNPQDGAGGLATGSSGKVLCLLSGGIDSPVAAYQMMKRGAEVMLVHFQNQTQVTAEVSEKIIDLANVLSGYQPVVKLFIVPFADYQKQIVMKIPADYRMIASRRLMFQMAEKIAAKEKCQALVTGDSLGQVASQTLENLSAIYEAVGMLKIAPLIGMNKVEIMRLARKIGTLDISNRPYEDCCSLFVAKHPQTKAKIKDVLAMEKALDLPALTLPTQGRDPDFYVGVDKSKTISYNISMNNLPR